MNTCKTCKHFSYQDIFGFAACKSEKWVRKSGNLYPNPPIANDLASDQVRMTNYVIFVVGPDFGCVHHESE